MTYCYDLTSLATYFLVAAIFSSNSVMCPVNVLFLAVGRQHWTTKAAGCIRLPHVSNLRILGCIVWFRFDTKLSNRHTTVRILTRIAKDVGCNTGGSTTRGAKIYPCSLTK